MCSPQIGQTVPKEMVLAAAVDHADAAADAASDGRDCKDDIVQVRALARGSCTLDVTAYSRGEPIVCKRGTGLKSGNKFDWLSSYTIQWLCVGAEVCVCMAWG